mmetsp:Transcript_3033/g.6473  ORF Transcript_3033/g.6473 Transcript_3033/m.6473 type:complete len:219 (+) Transcript_3033:71-727(+)
MVLMASYTVTMIAEAGMTVARRIVRPRNSTCIPPAIYRVRTLCRAGVEHLQPVTNRVQGVQCCWLGEVSDHTATCCCVFSTSKGCVQTAAAAPEVAPDKNVDRAEYRALLVIPLFPVPPAPPSILRPSMACAYRGRRDSKPSQYMALKGQSRIIEGAHPRYSPPTPYLRTISPPIENTLPEAPPPVPAVCMVRTSSRGEMRVTASIRARAPATAGVAA